jgi:hypothetical protein
MAHHPAARYEFISDQPEQRVLSACLSSHSTGSGNIRTTALPANSRDGVCGNGFDFRGNQRPGVHLQCAINSRVRQRDRQGGNAHCPELAFTTDETGRSHYSDAHDARDRFSGVMQNENWLEDLIASVPPALWLLRRALRTQRIERDQTRHNTGSQLQCSLANHYE